MKQIRKCAAAWMILFALLLSACGKQPEQAVTAEDTAESTTESTAESSGIFADYTVTLSSDSASINGEAVEEFDYTWHCDPSAVHGEVDNAPAEYCTGTKPQTDAAAYIDRELYYFPQLPENGFCLVNYDGEQEWAYYYTDGENDGYIFATLPRLGNTLPTQMMHTEQEAAENKVLHLTRPGIYRLSGSWQGQIWISLGDKDETFTDENAKVTLILDNADISCSVAPGIVCYSAYECDNGWEDRGTYSETVDTDNAGMTVVLADGSENTVTGTNVFRMLKTKYKDENSEDAVKVQKKMRKTDGALYSYVTMQICGEAQGSGRLTVNSGFEGIDSELHLTFNGGNITVHSQDDGINVNEDNVSVVCFNGGTVTLNAAQGTEGDGVDSNGYIVLNGTALNVNGIRVPDNALDSECGVYYNAGTVVIDGQTQDYTAGEVFRESGETGRPGQPGEQGMQPPVGDPPQDFDLQAFKQAVADLPEDATREDVLALLGMGAFTQGGTPGEPPQGEEGKQPPQGEQPPNNVSS